MVYAILAIQIVSSFPMIWLVLVRAALSNRNSQVVAKVLVSPFHQQIQPPHKWRMNYAPSSQTCSLVWHAAKINNLHLAKEDSKLFHQLSKHLTQLVSQDALTVASSIWHQADASNAQVVPWPIQLTKLATDALKRTALYAQDYHLQRMITEQSVLNATFLMFFQVIKINLASFPAQLIKSTTIQLTDVSPALLLHTNPLQSMDQSQEKSV